MIPNFTMYIDASGDPGWPPPYGKSQNNYYVLVGIAMPPEADHKAHVKVQEISEIFFGKWEELKYTNLIFGKGPYKHLSDEQRKKLADSVFDLILELRPTLFATIVDKTKMKCRYGSAAINPMMYALRALVGRFSKFLQRKKALGTLVMDSEEHRKNKQLRSMIYSARRYGIGISGLFYQPPLDKLERLLNTISFTPSEMCPGIQLADFCAHSIFLCFERNKCRRFKQIEPLFDRSNNTIWEPSIVPK